MQEETSVVLVVERDADRADLYATWLRERWTVRVVHDTRAALPVVGEVDAVVFGTGRPDQSEAIADAIRERDTPVPTAVVVADDTATESDLEPDDRLAEPVSAAALREAVSELLARRAYVRRVDELYSVAAERAAVESERSGASPERRQELERRVDDLRNRVDDTLDALVEASGFAAAYRAVDDGSGDADGA